ncbi:MAG: hypothetical protein N3D10_02625 [Candidatus Micrarchaeota archaeon]|nr:hypothetical protein [Candidatus Micrarchaeota archaeon]
MTQTPNFNKLKESVINKGGFFVYLYFDLHSTDKENMKNLAVNFSSKLTNEKGVAFGISEIEEPIYRDELYSTAIKATLLVEDFSTLVRLTMSYMPIAIEIEEPLDVNIDAGQIQRSLMEVSNFCQQLTNHILFKGMNEEEKKRFQQELAAKIILGKKIMEKIEQEEKTKKEG